LVYRKILQGQRTFLEGNGDDIGEGRHPPQNILGGWRKRVTSQFMAAKIILWAKKKGGGSKKRKGRYFSISVRFSRISVIINKSKSAGPTTSTGHS